MAKYRIVFTDMWYDEKFSLFTPEDKLFWAYILTNKYAAQIGIYQLDINTMAREIGYSKDTIIKIINRFSNQHEMIKYSESTKEIAVKNYIRYINYENDNLTSLLMCEADKVIDKSLLEYIYTNNLDLLENKKTSTSVKNILKYINTTININNNIKQEQEQLNKKENIISNDILKESMENTPIDYEKPFKKPTIAEISQYVEENKLPVDAIKFYNHYEGIGWKVGKHNMLNWKNVVQTWARNYYNPNNNNYNQSKQEMSDLKKGAVTIVK